MRPRGSGAAVLLLLAAVLFAGPVAVVASDLGGVPVSFEGRIMPFETAGQLVLYRFAGRNRLSGRDGGEMLDRIVLAPFAAVEDEMFLVDDPAVLETVGYPAPERGRYSYLQLYPYLESLNILAVSLLSVERELSTTEEEIRFLANNIKLFEGLASTMDIFRGGADSAYSRFANGLRLSREETTELPGMLRLVPPSDSAASPGWRTPARAIREIGARENAQRDEAVATAVLDAWAPLAAIEARDHEAADRSTRVQEVARAYETPGTSIQMGAVRAERVWNAVRPQLWASVAALIALLVAAILGRERPRAQMTALKAGGITVLALLTFHQLLRFVIMRRPPVTDLPSSFKFVAWVLAAVGVAMSRRRRESAHTGLLTSLLGSVSLLYLARMVTGGADPFGVVQAVLDTNFWLTTHVLVITAGYAGVIASGVTGHIFLVRRIRRPYDRAVHQTTFRTMLVLGVAGLALTFLGTILGGVWADQSWGRFWGWDPKENGALLIILWSSIALHARLSRWVSQNGFAAAAIIGVPVVFFSWLGVNLMGVGLHSYGFTAGSFWALVIVVAAEITFAIAAWILADRRRDDQGMHTATVIESVDDGDARLLTITSPNGHYRAGQYVGVRPEGERHARPFSVVHSEPGTVKLLVKGAGSVSTQLAERAGKGATIEVSSGAGEFRLDSPSSRTVVFAAGGVGIAPLLSMAEEALRTDRLVVLIRASRTHLYATEQLQALRRKGLVIVDLLSQPPESWRGARGHLSRELLSRELLNQERAQTDISGADWYLAGSPEFCESAREVAGSMQAALVYEEQFTPAVDPPEPPEFRARITLGATTLEVLPGQTILEAAHAAGMELQSSCRSGTCGECSCLLRSGSVHQGVAPATAQAGDAVHTCVAYPASPEGVALDPVDSTTTIPSGVGQRSPRAPS